MSDLRLLYVFDVDKNCTPVIVELWCGIDLTEAQGRNQNARFLIISQRSIHTRLNKIKLNQHHNVTSTHNRFTPHISFPFNDQYDKIAAILKSFNIRVFLLLKKNLNSIIMLGKDITEKWDRTNIVYKFVCKTCPASYVGEIKRSLKTRINEHKKEQQ